MTTMTKTSKRPSCSKCGALMLDGVCSYASSHPRARCEKCGGFMQANRPCMRCLGAAIERAYAAR